MTSSRLDHELVSRGLTASRSAARRAILDGAVTVDGRTERRPASRPAAGAVIDISADGARVGRGGRKMAAALDAFGIDVEGRRVLDAGASTGGFTEVLLAAGAAHVTSIDVGHGQLAPSLASHARVTNIEGQNVRYLRLGQLGPPFAVAVADLSFISLTKVAVALAGQVSPDGDIVLLIKPQFEVGPDRVGRGGLVRDPDDHRAAIESVEQAWSSLGWHSQGVVESPVLGGDGNKEFLMHLRRTDPSHVSNPASVAR